MKTLASVHGSLVFARRIRVLARLFAELLPRGAAVLDIGCGDGSIDELLLKLRPDLSITGVDVLVRPGAKIAVTPFDGRKLPFADAAFDFAMLVDVVHHADDPAALFVEAARVGRRGVVLKDHLCEGPVSRAVLSFMDWVGNAPHGVRLPYNYLGRRRWEELRAATGLTVGAWTGEVPIYPWPASLVFGAGLHFVARLERAGPQRPAGG